jgi:LPXTG-motif cell wall-anchored protein
MSNGLYYPILAYGADYAYCGETDGSDSTVTQDNDGSVTIDCQPNSDLQVGITVRMHLRLYPETATGYLARQWIEYTNTTQSEITLDDPVEVDYFFGSSDYEIGQPWLTNQGADVSQNGDVWTAQGSTSGDAIATSSAWGSICSAPDWTMGFDEYAPYLPHALPPSSSVHFAPGETKNRVTFINMTFPATNDSAGAEAAFAAARTIAQTEFSAGLTGRLVDGLPAGLVAVGWNDGACAPLLPNTGVDSTVSAGIAAGASAIALLGLGLGLVVARRRAHTTLGR